MLQALRNRFRAARRVLSHYHWVRAASDLRAPLDLQGPDGGLVARLNALSVREGYTEVAGVSHVPVLNLTTERANRLIVANAAQADGSAFHVRIEGARQLWCSLPDTGQPRAVKVYSLRKRLRNLVVTLTSLSRFPLRHRRDLLRYFWRGDSEAGDRLERALLPLVEVHESWEATYPLFPGEARRKGVPGPAPDCTIIVPVYNAPKVTEICLRRLGQHTDPRHRILVVDDASPDPSVRPILTAFVASHPQAELLINEKNLGFIGSVNRALGLATGHVVLLNSDAFVPADWLDRLMEPIARDPMVASVTPMSNAAEILSAPVICKDWTLQESEVDAIDKIARKLSPQALADLPTGVGFCMAMARPWIDALGGFDTIFGKGYGEEVDWCRRASRAGGHHVGLGSLFVMHQGKASFGTARSPAIETSGRIINQRYPGFDRMVQEFIAADPLAPVRLALSVAMASEPKKPMPIYLAHTLGGGAELSLTEHIERDLQSVRGALVIRDGPADRDLLAAEVHTAAGVTKCLLPPADLWAVVKLIKKRHLIYSCLVAARDPLHLLQSALASLSKSDRFTILFHDYFPVCPSYNLISADRSYCGLPAEKDCQSCYQRLSETSGRRPAQIAEWRSVWRQAARRANELTAFSPDTARRVTALWPECSDRVVVRPHPLVELPRAVVKPASEPPVYTLGVLGGIGYSKGAGVLKNLALEIGADFRIVIIGKIDPAYAASGIIVHGSYKREEIAELAERYGITAWLVPSIWPETFCYALHECLATTLPVYGFDIGAQGDTLREAPNGHVLPLDRAVMKATFVKRETVRYQKMRLPRKVAGSLSRY